MFIAKLRNKKSIPAFSNFHMCSLTPQREKPHLDDTRFYYLFFKQLNNMKFLQGLLPSVNLPITQQSLARFLQVKPILTTPY